MENITLGQHKTKTLWDQVGIVLHHTFIDCMKGYYMNYDFIYSSARGVVFMESKKIDKQGIKVNTKELGYKKYDELRKVLK